MILPHCKETCDLPAEVVTGLSMKDTSGQKVTNLCRILRDTPT